MLIRNRKYIIILILTLLSEIVLPQSRSLDYYINEGLSNSPLLKDLDNQLRGTSVDSILVKAAKKPQVEARSQVLYAPFYHNFGYDEVITDGGNYQAVAAVTQSIFNRKELDNKFKSLEIQKQSINNSTILTSADLKRTIADKFITAFSDYSEIQFNISILDLMKSENELVKQFAQNGIYSQTDYLSLIVETQGQEVLINQTKNQYKKDLRLLNQVCGINDTTACELAEPQFNISGTRNFEDSPFFRQFAIDSLKLLNEKYALDAKYIPKINWFADAGALSSTPGNIYRHFGYSVGASLSVPIYDGHQKTLESRKIDISQNTLSNYLSKYKMEYDQSILQLNEELRGIAKTSSQISAQLSTANQLVSSLKAQLETGHAKMTDYINAIKNCRNINWNMNLINIRIMQIKNEINYFLTQ